MSKVLKVKNGVSTTEEGKKAKLFFYGDIASERSFMDEYYPDTQCPTSIAEFLGGLRPDEEIEVHINSGGGSVFAGLAIYNQLKGHSGIKKVYVDGIAASIASVIMMAGDEIIVGKGAQVMIHDPFCWGSGNASDLRRMAETLDTAKDSILDVYETKATDQGNRDKLSELMASETWLSAKDAAELFTITVDDQMEAVACADSRFYNRYKARPNEPTAIDKREKLIAEEDELEKEKNKLLMELELI